MNNRTIGCLAALILGTPLLALGQKNGCLDCHAALDDDLKAPAVALAQDVHGQAGLGCADCHGGNPAEDDVDRAKDRSFRGAPERDRIPEFCGGCHADAAVMRRFNPTLRVDQLDLYWTSRHGQLVKKGDIKAAVCTDCHGAHGVQSAKFPKSSVFPWNIPQTCGRCHADKAHMEAYRIPIGQVEDYKASVHAQALWDKKDLSAPACNDCHGNHGAYPPEAGSVAAVCRQCHPSASELFNRSPHKKAFDEMGLGECDACHGNHRILRPTNALIGTDEGATCVQCHEPGSKAYAEAGELRKMLDAQEAGFRDADGVLALAERRGVEVSSARYRLNDVNTGLITAKNLTHGLDGEEIRRVLDEADKGLAEVRVMGEKALGEARFRRRGLALATILCALLAVALALKVRDRARRRG